MALDPTKVVNDPQNLGAIRYRKVIDYSGGNQTVSAATGGVYTACRGLHVTVAGNFELVYVGDSTAVIVPLGIGYWGDNITQVNTAGSTGSGFYLF